MTELEDTLFTLAGFIGTIMALPWFCAPPLEVFIWAPIDEMLDSFADWAVDGRMGGPTAVLNS